MLRALIHHFRINLAVAAGAAVATAVLAGALLVGDSVRGSLRALTLERLGRIDHAVTSNGYFDADLAERLAQVPSFAAQRFEAAVPAIALSASAVHGTTGARAAKVALLGVDERFAALFPEGGGLELARKPEQLFPPVAINAALARETGATVGDALVLSFGRAGEAPRETPMGRTAPEDVLGSLRVTVGHVLPDRGLGRFALGASQQEPLNAFVALSQLQRVAEERGRANVLLVAGARDSRTELDTALASAVALGDLGLKVVRRADHLTVESREFVLRPAVDEALGQAAADLSLPLLRVQVYLANAVQLGERVLPYSMLAALGSLPPQPWSSLEKLDGSSAGTIPDGELWLNAWAADDLGARPGDEVEVEYYVLGPREELTVERTRFRVGPVLAMKALGADPALTPEYPGLRDAHDMSAWEPPFPVDLSTIRAKDESYWDEHRGAPKGFVSADTGRRLFSTRFGSTTSARIGLAPGLDAEATERQLAQRLLTRLTPQSAGLEVRAVKAEGLAAAAGATDFAGLFLGFSLFLIVSAALLVGLLFALNVERRAGEIGLLLSIGYTPARVRRSLLAEGAVLASLGALAGLALGAGYAALLMLALRTVWLPAVGSSALELHVTPQSLVIGGVAAIAVVLLAIFLAVRRLRGAAPAALLAGSFRDAPRKRRGRLARLVALGGFATALILLGTAAATRNLTSPGLTLGAGAALLVAGLASFALWCRPRAGHVGAGSRTAGFAAMAARNTTWNPGRSVLSVALVAAACFLIVVVGANREEPGEELLARESGSGGFALVASSDVPVHQNLESGEDRAELGLDSASAGLFEGVHVYPLRVLPGDDASCLNLYRPGRPRILGAPRELIERGGFRFRGTTGGEEQNPWRLLETELEPGVVPAIADYNSARWILHLNLGGEIALEDELGQPLRLRLVGLLERSLLQSELVISEEAFLRHFPRRTGYGQFLIDAPTERTEELAHALEAALGRFGFDAMTARDKLAAFRVVENTYLSTFQALGGLGLLLGTAGLAVVLVRSVIERRKELAALRAFGFRRASLAWLVVAENAFLLIVGLGIGSGAALAAIAPRLHVLNVPWASLAATLLLVFAVGMLAGAIAVGGALRIPLLPALKAER